MNNTLWNKYSYFWVTLGFLLFSLIGHWLFGWAAFVNEQEAHGLPPEFSGYLVEMLRDTFENWQSEFLQLLWQVAGLAYFFYVGSSQSRESDERVEEKIDALLRHADPKHGDTLIRSLDQKYLRK